MLAAATRMVRVQPGFFHTLDVRLIAGRDFRIDETSTQAAVAVVNESFARRHFGTPVHALGRRVRPRHYAAQDAPQHAPWHEIVGVVPDIALNPGDPAHSDGLYLPIEPATVVELIVRTTGDAQAVLPHVIDAVRTVNADIELQSTGTLEETIRLPARLLRGAAAGFMLAGAIALMLSMLSLYALMAYAVTRRSREIGIRIAIGATPRSVIATVLGRGLRQMVLGIALGALLSLALARIAISAIPFQLARGGPVELAAITALLAAAGISACLRPVRRVLATDPIEAIRSD
jgi:hypothetical protein